MNVEFRIADTFTDSLAKLSGDEQKAVKTSAFDLQLNPANPGMQFHRINQVKDPSFWSIRVSRDIRIIVHKTDASLLLCYVDHHDSAYDWAARRRIERHPKTGAAQLVEIRETIKDVIVPRYVEEPAAPAKQRKLFADVPADDLLSYGVPADWLADVLEATEENLFELSEHLPQEAAEALLDLATGTAPTVPEVDAATTEDPFAHPDAQRRFRLVTNVEELERALDYPWEKWTVFLHPAQRRFVEKSWKGPARIAGSAGTGKTIVALHRAVFLGRKNPDGRVLLTTFSPALAMALAARLKILAGNEAELVARIRVSTLPDVAAELFGGVEADKTIAEDFEIRTLLSVVAETIEGHRFTDRFLWMEWRDIVDAWGIKDWEDYRDVQRLGRKTRLSKEQREVAWKIFSSLRQEMEKKAVVTRSDILAVIAQRVSGGDLDFGFDNVVVDEAQDISVPELSFVAACAGSNEDGLFFSGDLGQRIFQTPFSWKSLGVDIRGRSHTLRINYRTSQQIRTAADRLLPPAISDVDGNSESRKGTVSVFEGPRPDIRECEDEATEITEVCNWIRERVTEGFQPREIGVVVRSECEMDRAESAIQEAGLKSARLTDHLEPGPECVSVATMHLAKGLEFRAVVVMACDDEVIPSQERVETVADDSDLEEVYNTERHLLYVACTRARDLLLVSGVDPVSEFLSDLQQ